ncbi:MAG: GNAT family N-acetyltransferase, partial [Spirochaetes bacterium]|nr:GNAT family N-acetyltransferase [Spirochaetota bacterium]
DLFLDFFENIAFTDNPDWAHCYCVFFHHHNSVADWFTRSKEDNRTEAIQLIKEGVMKGFFALENDKPIAWCNANEKRVFSFEKLSNDLKCYDDSDVIAITCFLVAKQYRHKGITKLLLNTIIADYTDSEYKYLEAYPKKDEVHEADNYHGPLSLYLKNGFYIEKELEEFSIVRYKLKKN